MFRVRFFVFFYNRITPFSSCRKVCKPVLFQISASVHLVRLSPKATANDTQASSISTHKQSRPLKVMGADIVGWDALVGEENKKRQIPEKEIRNKEKYFILQAI